MFQNKKHVSITCQQYLYISEATSIFKPVMKKIIDKRRTAKKNETFTIENNVKICSFAFQVSIKTKNNFSFHKRE